MQHMAREVPLDLWKYPNLVKELSNLSLMAINEIKRLGVDTFNAGYAKFEREFKDTSTSGIRLFEHAMYEHVELSKGSIDNLRRPRNKKENRT